MTAEVVAQALLSGLLMGCVYALIAAGLSLIFGLMEIVNFAHGELLMLAMFATFWAWALAGLDPVLALPLATLLLFGVGWVVYRGVIQPHPGRPRCWPRSSRRSGWRCSSGAAPSSSGPPTSGSSRTPGSAAGSRSSASSSAHPSWPRPWPPSWPSGLLYWFITRTETGLALQATAQDRQAAALMGINTERMFALGWGLGAACVGAAGALLANFFYVFPDVGADASRSSPTSRSRSAGSATWRRPCSAGALIGLVENLVGPLGAGVQVRRRLLLLSPRGALAPPGPLRTVLTPCRGPRARAGGRRRAGRLPLDLPAAPTRAT